MLKMIGFMTGIALTAAVLMGVTGDLDTAGVRARMQSMVAGDEPAMEPSLAVAKRETGNDSGEGAPFSSLAALETIAAEPVPVEPSDAAPAKQDAGADEQVDENPAEGASQPATVPDEPQEIRPQDDNSPAENAYAAIEKTSPPLPFQDSGAAVGVDQVDDGVWHAFWTPFRSEASANGFASRLERETGREYKVIRKGPGQYRVAFYHTDDSDRRARLVEIEQVSGLQLSGGEL